MVNHALALEVTSEQDALIEDIVTSLPESTYRNLPLASEVEPLTHLKASANDPSAPWILPAGG